MLAKIDFLRGINRFPTTYKATKNITMGLSHSHESSFARNDFSQKKSADEYMQSIYYQRIVRAAKLLDVEFQFTKDGSYRFEHRRKDGSNSYSGSLEFGTMTELEITSILFMNLMDTIPEPGSSCLIEL